ncbi:ABC transporter substrate-binding protein [Mycolicibacterium sp. 050232]|uniref:ABC transporter substrate-binding protein n=1 Tax=Mycolicibacterium sp. 050232 TaxID=3113982 RepID=UPI002E2A290D|nr:ABC transporter substrate-binding protein [Mycolicibacterium sp. 050232]MED5815481.1 ABC transporter substrate-binding protein [Mycolicibacterium sp. 050232]
MGDFTFGWPTHQLTTDPRLAYNSISKTYCRLSFESLVDIAPDGGQLLPWLAGSWHYRDPLTLDLTIRPGRCFSDGAPLTPEAVAQSFSDIAAMKQVSPLPAAVTMLTGLGHIEAGIDTVTFHFVHHNAAFLRSLAGVNLAIRSPAGLGTGRWVQTEQGVTDGERRLTFREADTGDLYAGSIDGYHMAEIHNPGISYGLCPNASRGPLTDPRVRRALSLLIDRAALQPILDAAGYTVASSVLTPTTEGYRDCSAELTYDPAAAHRLLAASGAQRLSFEVLFNSTFSPVDASLLAAVAAQWQQHGIELSLADVDFPELRRRQQSGAYDFRFFYFTGSDPDLLRYQLAVDQRNMNRRTRADDLDALLYTQLSCTDPDARRAIVHDIQRRILTGGLWLPLCNIRTVTSYRPDRLSGVYLDTEALARIP